MADWPSFLAVCDGKSTPPKNSLANGCVAASLLRMLARPTRVCPKWVPVNEIILVVESITTLGLTLVFN